MTTTQQPITQPTQNGLGISTFVVGLVGAVLGTIPILGVPALICGLTGFGLGLGALRRLHKKTADNRVMSWFGVVLSVLAVVLGIIGIAIVEHAFSSAS